MNIQTIEEEEQQSEIEALSSKFEAVQIAMTKDKHGYILKLAIHPNDIPEDLLRDLVGTRYLIVAVRMNDQGEPIASPSTREGLMAVKIAASLCRDERFQIWLGQQQHIDELSEDAAAVFLRSHCGVKSRSELKVNRQGRDRLLALRDEFADHLRRGTVPKQHHR
jgi:hypothetical protein